MMSRSPGGRRPNDPLKAASAAFRQATTKPIEGPPKAPSIPGGKETVTLRIDQDVLEFFQEDGRAGRTGLTQPSGRRLASEWRSLEASQLYFLASNAGSIPAGIGRLRRVLGAHPSEHRGV
jgi:hypothetical protein